MRISACLIYGPDESPDAAIASIRQYVDEVITVASTTVPGAHDAQGRICDFSKARQASFDLATGDWIVWLDSDDLIDGGEHLRALLQATPGGRVLFPYEYAYDGAGRCVSRQYRERAVRRVDGFRWQYPVHEVLVRQSGATLNLFNDGVVWRHQRKESRSSSGRNLRILREYAHEQGADSWALMNLGQECIAVGLRDEARDYLERYVATSEWPEQKAMACVRLFELATARRDTADATMWATRAAATFPSLDTHYAAASAHYLATFLGGAEELSEAVEHAKVALTSAAAPVLSTNPQTRSRVIDLLVSALNAQGNANGALQVIDAELERTDSPALRLQRRQCAVAAARADFDGAVRQLQTLNEYVDVSVRYDATDLVIACMPTAEAWDPESAERQGIGGSETAVIEMAKRLVKRGFRVRVFADVVTPGIYDGVEYLALDGLRFDTHCDVLVAWRDAGLLEMTSATLRLLWVHDVAPHHATPERIAMADRVLALSHWHRGYLQEHGIPDEKITVTRNGIDLARFDQVVERDPHKAIYSSSPDRGLETLLAMWPAIRAQVPDAELHCFYGFASTLKPEFVERVTAKTEALKDQGVVLRGRVDQKTLAREMLSAGAWLYPTAFTETSCITAMEAQAAGLAVVTTGVAALAETADVVGNVVDLQNFVSGAVAMLMSDDALNREGIAAYARSQFSWDGVADEWAAMIAGLLGEKDAWALPAYEPVEAFDRAAE